MAVVVPGVGGEARRGATAVVLPSPRPCPCMVLQ